MKKRTKSVITAICSVTLVMSLSMPAFAEDYTISSRSYFDNQISGCYYSDEQLEKYGQDVVNQRIIENTPKHNLYVGWFDDYEKKKEEERLAAEAEAARIAAEEARAKSRSKSSRSNAPTYSSGGNGVLTRSGGVNYYNGRRETWYSQRVLPGGGLKIPGRHVDPSDGTVRDGDGYICVAASDTPKGTVVQTSLGAGKVYDSGCAAGTNDIYVDW